MIPHPHFEPALKVQSYNYYRQRIRGVNFLDSEARELPMRHKNWWMGLFGRRGLEHLRIGKQKLHCIFFAVVNKNLQ